MIYLTHIKSSGISSDRRIITLLELLRLHAEIYVDASFVMGLIYAGGRERLTRDNIQSFRSRLQKLSEGCQMAGLLTTKDAVDEFIYSLDLSTVSLEWWIDPLASRYLERAHEIVSRLQSELSHKVFFQIRQDAMSLFTEPRKGWGEIIERFPDTVIDIEESARCFALSRYAASVFHSIQVVEVGLIHLGKFLGVNDPLTGWTAVTGELKRLVNKKYPDKTQFEKDNALFIEQMQGCTEALKNAWRNKISHAQGRLYLLVADFSPDIAEEIMMASRAFMRRLATELPVAPN